MTDTERENSALWNRYRDADVPDFGPWNDTIEGRGDPLS